MQPACAPDFAGPVGASPLPHLREATAEQHRNLEDHLNLLRPGLTLPDYQSVLKRFYGFWRPWEASANQALGDEYAIFFSERRKAEALRSDLLHLGVRSGELERVPLTGTLPKLDSVDAALGSMYVIEGSTLGGQLLSRHFIERLGILPNQCSFFSGYGPRTGLMWKRFGIELSKRPVSSYSAMASAANRTFQCLRQWL